MKPEDAYRITVFLIVVICLAFGLAVFLSGCGPKPTFHCKDGTDSFAKTSQGACSGHGGIQ